MSVQSFFVRTGPDQELCYYLDIEDHIPKRKFRRLIGFMRKKPGDRVFRRSRLTGEVLEIGTHPTRTTPFCSQALTLLHTCGYTMISRIEVFRRFKIPEGTSRDQFAQQLQDEGLYDPMVERIYPKPLVSFVVKIEIAPVITVPILGEDLKLMEEANKRFSMGLNKPWMKHFKKLFEREGRNPTDAELVQIREMVSNHSFHGYFNAVPIINGVRKKDSLMDLIKLPWKLNPGNSVVAFHDNASAIRGGLAKVFISTDPTAPAPMGFVLVTLHPTLTCETHNYPTYWYAWAGAETGIGGCLRDSLAIGIGGEHRYAIAGFSSGNLFIPGYIMPWEKGTRRFTLVGPESPLDVQLKAPWGTWAYGNAYGVPTIQGFARTFGMDMPNGDYYAYWKPIMFVGLAGVVREEHTKKSDPEKGLLIVQIGGTAQLVGIGGGSGSSEIETQDHVERDLNAVQRGDPLMAQTTWRVIRACVELGLLNPIISIHDQGAAGPCNIITELIEKAGGRVDIRQINVGDVAMSILQLWIAEYQERYGMLIHPEHLDLFKQICARENCPVEVLGKVTGDGRIVVFDSQTGETPVDLPIDAIRKGLPRLEIEDSEPDDLSAPVEIPTDLEFREALTNVLHLLSVGSKLHLVNRVDTSVGGLVVRGQACGPLGLPVSDVAVSAHGYLDTTGQASGIGECAPKTTLDPRAGSRMAIAEMVTNLMAARITDFSDIKASVNWMWPAKGIKGGLAKLYYAMEALSAFMAKLGIAPDGGKDSLSMAVAVLSEIVKSPETVVATGYGYVPDISKVATPDIKKPGGSCLILIDHGLGKNRLGGSAFLQTLKQLGDECPDINDPEMFVRTQKLVQRLHDEGKILAYHDRSDGGVLTALLEMLMPGDCGAEIFLRGQDNWRICFSEEAGQIIEVDLDDLGCVEGLLKESNLDYALIGVTMKDKILSLSVNSNRIADLAIPDWRKVWGETAYQLDRRQTDPRCSLSEWRVLKTRKPYPFQLLFEPSLPLESRFRPKVAVLRAIGTNGDREMAAALTLAGFEAWDVTMTDLIKSRISLDIFQGIVFPGGFSFRDVFGAGKGWSELISYGLKKIFDPFLRLPDTFVLGPCNGAQVGTRLGLAPYDQFNSKTQPLFLENRSRAFESRWLAVKILKSPSIMFKGMEGSILSIPVAHGEGQLWLPGDSADFIRKNKLATMAFVDDNGKTTTRYPFNPNGSSFGWTGLCDQTGRFNFMMPHPERAFLKRQLPWMPEEWRELTYGPWMQAFINLQKWAVENRLPSRDTQKAA